MPHACLLHECDSLYHIQVQTEQLLATGSCIYRVLVAGRGRSGLRTLVSVPLATYPRPFQD